MGTAAYVSLFVVLGSITGLLAMGVLLHRELVSYAKEHVQNPQSTAAEITNQVDALERRITDVNESLEHRFKRLTMRARRAADDEDLEEGEIEGLAQVLATYSAEPAPEAPTNGPQVRRRIVMRR